MSITELKWDARTVTNNGHRRESEEFCFLVFLLSRRCRHQPTAMDRRAEKVSTGWERCEGVILLNFHTPIIIPFVGLKSDGSVRMLRSSAVDTFSALPSMAKRQFGVVIIKAVCPYFH